MSRLWEVWLTPTVQLSVVDRFIMAVEVIAVIGALLFLILAWAELDAKRRARTRRRG